MNPRPLFSVFVLALVFASPAVASDSTRRVATTKPLTPTQAFQVPLPIIPTLAPTSQDKTTDYYDIVMQIGQKEIIPGTQTTIWGYNGMYPGPTIKAERGRTVVVRQVNNLPESTVVHLHGGHTPRKSDGLPYDLIGPGASYRYEYPNDQQGATLWYHDHAIDTTARHVYMGLAGFYLIHDPAEDELGLPSGANDVALMLQDRLFNSDASLNYPFTDNAIIRGIFGDRMLVNGAIQPYFQVARRKMRFRILNGSNARIYRLALSTGDPLTQIATDGGLLDQPVSRPNIIVSPGERVEVVIDFANYPVGTSLILKNQDTATPAIADIMRFDVVSETGTDEPNHPLPEVLDAKFQPVTNMRPVVRRVFTLEAGAQNGRTVWTVNGQLFDPNRIDARPKLNVTEIWSFVNNSGQPHPMHIHQTQWRIQDRNGVPPARGDDGWKDTFLVPGHTTVNVVGTFYNYAGTYVSHCHNLEHEDHAMMFNFEIVP
jgi:spore coat protein A, manganese oxidase